MDGEYRRRFVADLRLDLLLQRMQIDRRFISGGFVTGEFGGDLPVFQPLLVRVDEYLVKAVGSSDRHTR